MCRLLALLFAWMHVRGVRAKTRRNKRRVEIDAQLSKVWGPEATTKGYGNREFFTIELSKWFMERGDRAQIDELVEFLHTDCVYVIRQRPEEGATSRKRKRSRIL